MITLTKVLQVNIDNLSRKVPNNPEYHLCSVFQPFLSKGIFFHWLKIQGVPPIKLKLSLLGAIALLVSFSTHAKHNGVGGRCN